ncbi:sulfatase-like hydrolase/transferase [Salinispira pacifica]
MRDQPNIVLFMADQLIPMLTQAYGHPCAYTPNLNELAKEGVTFDAAYSTVPVCVPARCSELSGCYGATTGCFDNGGILPADWPTHNHYLNLAGYDTALAGKAHFVGPDQLHGFKQRFMTDIYPSGFRFMPRRGDEMKPEDLHPHPIAVDYLVENIGVRQFSMQMGYDEEALFHARMFLSGKRTQISGSGQEAAPLRDDKPFFLHVSLNHPHEPFHVLKEFWDLYEGVDIPIPENWLPDESCTTVFDRSLHKLHGTDHIDVTAPENLRALYRAYLASVSFVDHKLGQLRETLENFGLTENTIIIFVSDHGDMLGRRGMVQKRTFYEYSSRIPLIVHVPLGIRKTSAGRRVEEPVSLVDVAPTILELAGIHNYLPMDGSSLVPFLTNATEPDRHVFCENYSEGVDRVCLMVRKGPWKYTYIHGSEDRQLFNVMEDPEELHNLAHSAAHREKREELETLILSRFEPGELDRRAQRSYEQKAIVQRSMCRPGQKSWNYRPELDVDHMYWRD